MSQPYQKYVGLAACRYSNKPIEIQRKNVGQLGHKKVHLKAEGYQTVSCHCVDDSGETGHLPTRCVLLGSTVLIAGDGK